MNWISAEYEFGLPLKGIFFPGAMLCKLGIKAGLFSSVEKITAFYELVKDLLPIDGTLVRIEMPHNKDGVVLFLTSHSFECKPGYDTIEIIHIDNLKREEELGTMNSG